MNHIHLVAPGMFLAIPIVVLIYYDFKYRRLPNIITVPLAIIGLVYAFYQGDIINSMVAAVLLFAVFLLFALKGYMGGGDIKMAAALGIWLGYPNSIWVVCSACVLGVVTTMVVKARQGTLLCHLRAAGSMMLGFTKMDLSIDDPDLDPGITIPFGAYMGICSLAYIFCVFASQSFLF